MRYHLAFLGLAILVSVNALAQNRTFVSITGLDSNPCSRISPCRSFGAAVTAVAVGGEVIVLDSAGYGPTTIGKAVSLISPLGVYAGVTAAVAGNGIVINAPGATVVIRGVNIVGLGVGQDAIELQDAAKLHVENVVASGFLGSGIYAHQPDARFTVRDCEFRDNGWGVFQQAATTQNASIDHTRFDNNSNGVEVRNKCKTTIRDSVFFNDDTAVKLSPDADSAEASVENCVISALANGVLISTSGQATATARLSSTMIVNTLTGMSKTGAGSLVSFGNNRFDGNGLDGAFDTTILLK
jgi:hypothetical protein